MWQNKYIGIPFEEKGRSAQGLDCWGLVALIYKQERGIILPDYLDVYETTNDREILAKTIREERESKWIDPKEPKEFDVIILNMRGVPMHCGIVIRPGLMIHSSKDINTVIEKYDSMRWKNKVMGFARYE